MSKYYRVKTLMLKGQKGDTGYGISNVQMNDDYTLTITIENGMQFNTPPIRGEKGERGACIMSAELRDDYSLLFTLDNGETIETTAILGKEFENIRALEASATSASKIATNASTSASASAQSASEASISASESASNASTSASASAQSATNASQSATNAQESASNASTSADTATSKATEASASATKAKESETNAKLSETNASNSSKEAKASAVNAKASETKAKEYADNLQASTDDISKLKEDLVANTKEDTKTKRSLSALWALNNGISYRFETDSEKAYSKQTPSGSKLGAVNAIGGRTIVYNQYANINGDKVLWADDSKFSKNINELSGHKLYIMNKCVVTKILYDDRETYNKRLILFNENDDGVINVGNTSIKKKDIAVGNVFINKDIVQAPSILKTIRLYNIGDDNIGLTVECNSWVNVIDLTKMFGSGNEPTTTTEFEAMFTEDYYPYNEGTLMSMPVNEVDIENANLIKPSTNFIDRSGYTSKGVKYTYDANKVITINGTFKEDIVGGLFGIIKYKDLPRYGNYTISLFDENNMLASDVKFNSGDNGKTFNYNANNDEMIITLMPTNGKTYINKKYYLQLIRGEQKKTYSPYHKNTYPIPQAILELEGYGWGVNNVYNYVDYENKKFVKNVGKVNLDDYTWTAYQSDIESFYYCNDISSDILSEIKGTENILSLTGVKTIYNTQVGLRLYYVKGTVLNDTNKPTGYLYYELVEPIVTDISDIIGDTFQEPFNVESGGSLTFKNSNGDGYKLAVPSDIQYVVSLKEVTS
nr:MAG TPA: L SHAPED TAIL FIBER PROTEIN [Caudoviricetes sp.]